MKQTGRQYHKVKESSHEWTVSYTDVVSKKEVKFTCSNFMKKSHEILLSKNSFVNNVNFTKSK